MRKRRLFLGLGLALVSLVLASCDNESKETNNTTLEPTTETVPDTQTETTKEVVEKETVYICEGDTSDKTILSTQEIIKGKPVLPQIVAPIKEGYRVLNYRLSSSIDGDIIDSDFIYSSKKKFNLFVEWEKIDYNSVYEINDEKSELKDYLYLASGTEAQQANFYQNGFVKDKMPDYSKYKDDAYVQVKTADEFINAISQTKYDYETTWTYDDLTPEQEGKIADYEALMKKREEGGDAALTSDEKTRRLELEKEIMQYTGSISQKLNKEAKVHVIEITADLNLGYNKLSEASKALVTNWASTSKTDFASTSHFIENGVSQINLSNAYNLLIYSKNGSKITNAGFKVNSCKNVAFRNILMDEIWQWEDTNTLTPSFTVGDMDVFGWAYFKINSSTNIWIDHCEFGKSYDGQIDVANPYWYNIRTYQTAPFNVDERDEKSNVSISNCRFNSGSDDKDGYLYKMMEEIEADYQKSLTNTSYNCKYQYYKILRDKYKLSFDEILYGVAIPQKKAFLLGDSGESSKPESYRYNLNLSVSLLDNLFIDIEDRIPNVRGGIAYMANCVVDNSRYFKYRNILIDSGARGIDSEYPRPNQTKKPYFKLALVSQAIVGGYGASICAENCIFIGVSQLVKNNNSNSNEVNVSAGYKLINCIWYNDPMSEDYTRIINTDTNPNQIQSTVGETSPMTTLLFNWHNESNTNPIELALYKLDNLTKTLVESSHVGVNANYNKMYLYTDALYYTEKE